MDTYRTEEEQVEALKRWWSENGTSLLISVALAVAIGFGWQGWQARKTAEAGAASNLFQQMTDTLGTAQEGDDNLERAAEMARQIKSEFPATTYAQFAALHLARLAVGEGDLAGAEQELRWVVGETSAGEDLHQIARLRLARVLAASGSVEEALTLLEAGDGSPYVAAYAMARGDVLLAAGRTGEAIAAYGEAEALVDPARPLPGLAAKLEYLNPRQPLADVAAES